MRYSASMREPSMTNHHRMSFHCTGGKKTPRKHGFMYFLCCGCGNDEELDEQHQPYKAPFDKPKSKNGKPSSTNVTNNIPTSPGSRITSPRQPDRPSPPAYNSELGRSESRFPSIPIHDARNRYEKTGVIRFDKQPDYDKADAYNMNLGKGARLTLDVNGKDMKETETLMDKDPDQRVSFKSLFGNAPLYQIYDAHIKHKESKRFRHRLRSSLRRMRHAHKLAKGEITTPLPITAPHNFNESEDSSSSSDGEEEEEDDGHPETNKSGFRVLPQAVQRKSSNVQRTAKEGEMQNVAQEFAGAGPSRTHWAEMPDVKRLHLADQMTGPQRNLQEARFEIITSEASYFKSLTVLISLFYKSPVFTPSCPNAVINATDKHQLFSNIIDIRNTSENMLHALEMSFRKDPMMETICDILYEHSETKLSYYIAYVKNQMYQTRTLTKLMNRPNFAEAVKNIQSIPACNCLDLNSFLVLPMQRVMRLRLLVAAVLHYTPKNTPAHHSGLIALASIETLISECNSQKGYMEQKERLMTLSSQLEFKPTLKAIGMGNRHLVKEGNLRLLSTSKLPSQTFRRKLSDVIKNKPTQVTLFLFSDVLLVAYRRGEKYFVEDLSPVGEMEVTVDYTPPEAEIKRTGHKMKSNPDDPYFIVPNFKPARNSSLNRSGRSIAPPKIRDRSHSRGSNHNSALNSGNETMAAQIYTFILTFQSSDFTIVDYHFMTDTLEQRERWLDALQPEFYGVPREISYDTWDCPQVIAISSYSSVERDELDLKEGDLLNVIVDLSDGWLKGALPNGRVGWIPKQVCAEVEDPQARRQNMKNFLLSEEARRAYQIQKTNDSRGMFPRVHDYRGTHV